MCIVSCRYASHVAGLYARVGGRIERLSPLEEGNRDDKEVRCGHAPDLSDELACGLGRTTSRDQVIDDEHVGTLGDGVCLHLEHVLRKPKGQLLTRVHLELTAADSAGKGWEIMRTSPYSFM